MPASVTIILRKSMASQNGRAVLPRQYSLGCCDFLRQAMSAGSARTRGVETGRLQPRNHFGPARAVSKKSMDEYHVARLYRGLLAAILREAISDAAALAMRAVEKTPSIHHHVRSFCLSKNQATLKGGKAAASPASIAYTADATPPMRRVNQIQALRRRTDVSHRTGRSHPAN